MYDLAVFVGQEAVTQGPGYQEAGIFVSHFILFFCFLGLHLGHMEVPRLRVKSELQLLAYSRATAMPDPSQFCNLYHSSEQHQILNPLSKARD